MNVVEKNLSKNLLSYCKNANISFDSEIKRYLRINVCVQVRKLAVLIQKHFCTQQKWHALFPSTHRFVVNHWNEFGLRIVQI